jgi:uncharacterized protein (DUF488 family)
MLKQVQHDGNMRIFTIGYEGTTVPEFIAALQKASVERVIDVRALPLSRRPGFSKSALRAALEQAGIEYVHLKALGTPADGRAAARAGRHDELKRIYAGQLELPEAIAQGAQMIELARERPSALLCMEREPAHCHRTLLLDAIAADADVAHLYA